MVSKADRFPFIPLEIQGNRECRQNLVVSVERQPIKNGERSFDIKLPWPVTVTVLDEADQSDPINQLRVFSVRVGNQLGYRLTLTDVFACGLSEKDCTRFTMSVFFALAAERSEEIRAAIELAVADRGEDILPDLPYRA